MPKDINVARIGSKDEKPQYNNAIFTQFVSSDVSKQPKFLSKQPLGHLIHAHCWALLNQITGTPFSQTELQRFVHCARKYWKKNKLWGIYNDDFSLLGEETDDQYNSQDTEGYCLKIPHVFGSNIVHSPLVIFELQRAIELTKKRTKRNSTDDFTGLPLELQMMITQFVCPVDCQETEIQDTCNMLSAFGWILPKSFWELRLQIEPWRHLLRIDDHRLLFEFDLFDTNSFGWQLIYLAFIPLLRDRKRFISSGLASRERVLYLIYDILKEMEKSSC